MHNFKKKICVALSACMMGILVTVPAYAKPMEQFPAQYVGHYSTSYTRALQCMLMTYDRTTRAYIQDYGADGSYGSATRNSVARFQSLTSLTSDGSCGPATWTKLRTKLGSGRDSGSYIYYKFSSGILYGGRAEVMQQVKSTSKWNCYNGSWHTVD